jgi:hypothetical protein
MEHQYIFVYFLGLYMAYQQGSDDLRKTLRNRFEMDVFGDVPLCKDLVQKDADVLKFVPRITIFACALGFEH